MKSSLTLALSILLVLAATAFGQFGMNLPRRHHNSKMF
jgi:hypothetical protein